MPVSCHFRDCKALLVTSLTHVSGDIASVQTFTFTLLLLQLYTCTCEAVALVASRADAGEVTLRIDTLCDWAAVVDMFSTLVNICNSLS